MTALVTLTWALPGPWNSSGFGMTGPRSSLRGVRTATPSVLPQGFTPRHVSTRHWSTLRWPVDKIELLDDMLDRFIRNRASPMTGQTMRSADRRRRRRDTVPFCCKASTNHAAPIRLKNDSNSYSTSPAAQPGQVGEP